MLFKSIVGLLILIATLTGCNSYKQVTNIEPKLGQETQDQQSVKEYGESEISNNYEFIKKEEENKEILLEEVPNGNGMRYETTSSRKTHKSSFGAEMTPNYRYDPNYMFNAIEQTEGSVFSQPGADKGGEPIFTRNVLTIKEMAKDISYHWGYFGYDDLIFIGYVHDYDMTNYYGIFYKNGFEEFYAIPAIYEVNENGERLKYSDNFLFDPYNGEILPCGKSTPNRIYIEPETASQEIERISIILQ